MIGQGPLRRYSDIMEIGGPYPFRAVAAYQPVRNTSRPEPSVSAAGSVSVPATPASRTASSSSISQLVAARVPGGMDFDSSTMTPVRSSGAYQLYSRPTDRLEAATGVQRGRIIDLKA